uniref:Uncharacterized protein n=1 Tax=viral metagenome TaxID=1070528 RepID=A0A6M3L8W3_9ZZZZ
MAKTTKKPKAKRRLFKVKVGEISLVDNPAVPAARFLVAKRDEDEPMTEEVKTEVAEVVEEVIVKEPEPVVEPVVEPTPEPVETTVEIVKAADSWLKAINILRSAASDMDPGGLEMLANVIRYTMYRYGDDESVRTKLSKMGIEPGEFEEDADDIEKALKVIGPSNFGKIEAAAGTIISAATEIQGIAKSAKEIKKQDGSAEDEGDVQDDETPDVTLAKADDKEESKQEPGKESTSRPPSILDAAEAIFKERKVKAETEQASRIVAGLERIAERLDTVEQRQSVFAEGLKLARGKV